MTNAPEKRRMSLTRYAWLSIGAAVATIALKTWAYQLTGSVGLLSDALESLVNLAGAVIALVLLAVAARPPDDEHAFGHGKAEYFASGAEGTLIIFAAASIAIAAFERFVNPQALTGVGSGLLVNLLATGINLFAALVIRRAARVHNSVTLDANSRHLLADVWTSVGVVVAVAIVAVSKIQILDPLIAVAVAGHILMEGIRIVKGSILGLMDTALEPDEVARIEATLNEFASDNISYHALRTRRAGHRRFVSVHILVPGEWTVHHGHALLERIESEIREQIPDVTLFTHLESLDDPASWEDVELDRKA
ncbi:MAG: cation transporter [bacterium]|nr:cation transporter [bacterium]